MHAKKCRVATARGNRGEGDGWVPRRACWFKTLWLELRCTQQLIKSQRFGGRRWCCLLFLEDFEAASVSMEESLGRGRRTVTEPRLQPIRAQSLQEGLASSSTRLPCFTSWRSTGGPAEPAEPAEIKHPSRETKTGLFGAHIQEYRQQRRNRRSAVASGSMPPSLDRCSVQQQSC